MGGVRGRLAGEGVVGVRWVDVQRVRGDPEHTSLDSSTAACHPSSFVVRCWSIVDVNTYTGELLGESFRRRVWLGWQGEKGRGGVDAPSMRGYPKVSERALTPQWRLAALQCCRATLVDRCCGYSDQGIVW